MFRKFKITLNRVHDAVEVREGNDRLRLDVDGDPKRIVSALSQAQKTINGITDKSTDEDKRAAALAFAGAMFGGEQAEKLLAFYHDDPLCVLDVCGKYMKRFGKLVSKAQKKQ